MKTETEKKEAALVRRLTFHCKALNAVLKDARKIHPKACLYLANRLHLMIGHHHDDPTNSAQESADPKARTDLIIGSAILDSDGGDW